MLSERDLIKGRCVTPDFYQTAPSTPVEIRGDELTPAGADLKTRRDAATAWWGKAVLRPGDGLTLTITDGSARPTPARGNGGH